MVASTHNRRWPGWIEIGCSIGLIGGLFVWLGCLYGLPPYLGFGDKPQELPGEKKYTEGCKLLAEGKLAKGDLAKGRLEQAVTAFKEATKKDRANAMAYFKRANAYELLGKLDEAIDDFTEGLLLDRENAAGYRGRAAANLKKGRFEQAIDDLTKTISRSPDSYDAYCLRARANLAAEKYDDAINDARQAILLNAKCGDAFLTLGAAIVSSPNQQPERAAEYFKQAGDPNKSLTMAVDAEIARAYFNRGVNLDKTGKRPEAEQAFGEAGRRDVKYVALCMEYLKNRNVALSPYMTVRPILDPKLLHASALVEQKKFDEALDEFTNILHVDPKCADAWRGRGLAFLGKNDADSAIPDYERAIELAPNSAEAYCLRGQAYAKKGDYYRTISDTTEAIRLKPDYAPAYFHRAVAYGKDNNLERALADLDEAVRLDQAVPRLDSTLEDQARSLRVEIYESDASRQGAARRWDKAIESLKKALDSLDETLDSLKKPDKSSKDAIRFETNSAERLGRQLARAYQEWGFDRIAAQRWDEAIASLEKAISLENSVRELNPQLARAYRERGSDHANRGEFPEAVGDLNKALDLDKGNAQTCRLCGLTCCKMAKTCHDRGQTADEREQWEAAIKYLKRAISSYEPLDDARRYLDWLSSPA